ncbi:MAG TPA: hypothetical protein VE172_06690 [Stackebrandtia sp.]|jgi:Ni/Co efflux regulator RcnB|uniref:hypothetical protein n=1 Tax=Stackebrandtia sp. TaxID=2023065 RepID=UPI002D3A5B03|nr:hypothetical protein [Stackebrandtia sp.]HZE38485.1 hypothetical protein [Stackebrandtia sp.]
MRRVLLPVLLSAAVAASMVAATPANAQPTDAALAQRWAPVHHQDTDSSDYDADYLSTVNYDGDWDAKNNWEHQDDDVSRLTGAVYFSVVETRTHWFIVYSYFHPRDWDDNPFGSTHENDMEGAMLVVRRDGSQYGALEGMVTEAHTNFYSYVPQGSPLTDGRENIDGTIKMVNVDGVAHPSTRQEAKGHGCYAWDGKDFPGGDGVVYYPRGRGEVPGGGDDADVSYRLVDTFADGGLWARRADAQTYASFGTFVGDNGKDNAANTAWGWDDSDDGGDLPRGLMATDPAKLVNAYFDGTGDFALSYTRNGYRS